jgi:hypothetical protein
MDRIDLRHNTHVALAVALGADHADRRLVDQVRIGAKFARNPDGLGRAAWVAVDAYNVRFSHGNVPSRRTEDGVDRRRLSQCINRCDGGHNRVDGHRHASP